MFSQAYFGGNGQGQQKLGFTGAKTGGETGPEPVTEEPMDEEYDTGSRVENRGLFDSSAFGGGIGINWFDGPRGLGIDYSLLSGHDPIHSTNVNLIARKPIVLRGGESPIEIAPYAFVGAGVQAGRETFATGHAGVGIDLRFSRGPAIFLDTKYTVHDPDNHWPSVRLGIRIPLGRERPSATPRFIEYSPDPRPEPVPGVVPEPLSVREARPIPPETTAPAQPQTVDLWPTIDPVKKFPDNNNR